MTTEPIFAVGTGRCGTKTLAHLFRQLECEGVVSPHEPKPQLSVPAYLKLSGEDYDFGKVLTRSRGKMIEKAAYFLESSLWNTWLIDEFLKLWPQAKFIWLTRNIFDWAISTYRRGWYHPENYRSGPIHKLRPDPKNGWPSGVSRWFKLGWMWKTYSHQIVSVLSRCGAPWVQIDVNDLNNLSCMNSLVKWCGIPGELTKVLKENDGSTRLSIEEIKHRGIHKEFEEKLSKDQFDMDSWVGKARIAPYSWISIKRLKKLLGRDDVTYENIYEFTPEILEDLRRGVAYAD